MLLKKSFQTPYLVICKKNNSIVKTRDVNAIFPGFAIHSDLGQIWTDLHCHWVSSCYCSQQKDSMKSPSLKEEVSFCVANHATELYVFIHIYDAALIFSYTEQSQSTGKNRCPVCLLFSIISALSYKKGNSTSLFSVFPSSVVFTHSTLLLINQL